MLELLFNDYWIPTNFVYYKLMVAQLFVMKCYKKVPEMKF